MSYPEALTKHVCTNCDMRFWTVRDSTVVVEYCPHCGEDPHNQRNR